MLPRQVSLCRSCRGAGAAGAAGRPLFSPSSALEEGQGGLGPLIWPPKGEFLMGVADRENHAIFLHLLPGNTGTRGLGRLTSKWKHLCPVSSCQRAAFGSVGGSWALPVSLSLPLSPSLPVRVSLEAQESSEEGGWPPTEYFLWGELWFVRMQHLEGGWSLQG